VKKKQPIYCQIKQDMIHKIVAEEYRPGQCLPSERDLCEIYGVSRMTVRLAINELRSEGHIYKIQGKGTFVATRKIQQDLLKLVSFSYEMRQLGRVPGSRDVAVSEEKATVGVAEKLQIAIGAPVTVIERLRTANGEPLAFQRNYISKKLCEGIERYDFEERSLYEIFEEKYNIIVSKAFQSLETVFITGRDAERLNVPENSLGLFMRRETYSSNNLPVEYVESIYPGEKYVFKIELHR
jgi:GntR family transcriptional regulator